MKTKVYVAGPYSLGDPVLNVENAILAADKLAACGFVPFVPHLSHFWHLQHPHHYEFWMEQGSEWLRCCDAVLCLAGESRGAACEVELATYLEIPVFYDLQALVDHY